MQTRRAKILSSLVVIVIPLLSRGQQPFPTYADDPVWNVVTGLMGWQVTTYSTDTFRFDGTTTMCGHEYSVLSTELGGTTYFRNDDQRTLFRRSLNCDDKEYLAYDYSLSIGDTAYVGMNFEWSWFDTTMISVDTIETVIVSGVERRKFKVWYHTCFQEPTDPFFRFMYWLEGIGCIDHPFYPLKCFCDGCEVGYSLLCYDSLGTQLYQGGSSCYVTNVGLDENSNVGETLFEIVPLAGGNIRLLCPVRFTQGTLKIYDAAGREHLSLRLAASAPTIEEVDLPPGIYCAQLTDDTGPRWTTGWLNTP